MQSLVQAFEMVATGITVASTGTMLAVFYLVLSPVLQQEVKNDSRRKTM